MIEAVLERGTDDARALGAPYNEQYYAVFGDDRRPYSRSEPHWRTFFGAVADAIVADLRPRTVLDVGCAIGFLVEALRERGVDACGIDVSEYAISQVPEELRPCCNVGSVTEELPGHYDLVVCIEVLEHVLPAMTEAAITNLTDAADAILFSSTPVAGDEPTHVNVRSGEGWAELFARHGFARDPNLDADYVTSWAMVLRPMRDLPSLAHAYERRYQRTLERARAAESEAQEFRALQARRAWKLFSRLLALRDRVRSG